MGDVMGLMSDEFPLLITSYCFFWGEGLLLEFLLAMIICDLLATDSFGDLINQRGYDQLRCKAFRCIAKLESKSNKIKFTHTRTCIPTWFANAMLVLRL